MSVREHNPAGLVDTAGGPLPEPPLPQRRLTTAERARLGAEIVNCYVRARRALRGAPIAAAVANLRGGSSTARQDRRGLAEARRLGAAVNRTLALLPGDTRCLLRSLVLTRMLARRGIAATLVIGVRSGPDFLAHAWVEHAGAPVLDPGDGSYGRLVEL